MPNTYTQTAGSLNWGRRINSLIFYALILLIVLAPIPLGSNRDWSWSLCALLISFLSMSWAINTFWHQQLVSQSLHVAIIVLFLLPVIWALLQISTYMPSGWIHPLWQLTEDALGAPMAATISIAPDNGWIAVMRLLSYGLVFFLSFQFCRNPHRANSMLKWIAYAGVVYAVYGLIESLGAFNALFWTDQAARINKVTSTFVNRNSYVTYAGMGLLCMMAYSLANTLQRHGSANRTPMGKADLVEYYVFKSWKPLLSLMVLTTALISTQSRGGFISAGPAIVALLWMYGLKTKQNAKTLLVSIGGTLVIILLAFSVSNDNLMERMGQIQSGGAERVIVYGLTIAATGDNSLTGFGYGSYYEGFRMYRSEDVQYIYDKAHNTYLENSFELGIPAAVCLFLALASLLRLAIKGVTRRRRDWLYPAVGVAATMLVGIHSLFDFSLQIPAIAITYAAIMGMATAQSFSSGDAHS